MVRVHLGQLVLNLAALQRGQAAQLHVEDGLGLLLGQLEARLQVGGRGVAVLRPANRIDHGVEVIEGDGQAFEDVLARLGLGQIVLRAPRDDDLAVVDVVLQEVLQRQGARLADPPGPACWRRRSSASR